MASALASASLATATAPLYVVVSSGAPSQLRSIRSAFAGSARILRKISKPAPRSLSFVTKAVSEEPVETLDTEKLVGDLKEKFDAIENKPVVALYAGGAVLTLWLANAVVGAVDSLPLIPKFLELIGVGYTGWFTYRYLLFKSSRKELAETIEEIKGKISGSTGIAE